MKSFEEVRAEILGRERLLRGLGASGWALLCALGLTALALIFALLRLVPSPSPFSWITVNGFVAVAGFLWGWSRPLDITGVLFQADRNAGLGEKLVTLYELRALTPSPSLVSGVRAKDFLPLLEARFAQLSLEVKKALPIKTSERRRWLSVLALVVLCFALTELVERSISSPSAPSQPSTTAERPGSEPSSLSARAPELLQPPPATVAQKIPALRERLDQARAALRQNPTDVRARAILEQLQAEISEAQSRLLPSIDEEGESPTPPAEKDSQSESSLLEHEPGSPAPSRDDLPRGNALDQLIRALREVQGQAQDLSPEEMQKLLDELRSGNPEAAAIGDQALQSSQNNQEFSQKLEEALKNLEARQALNRQLEDLKREAQSALSRPEAPPPGQSQGATAEDLRNPEQTEPNQGTPETAEEIEGPRQPDAISKPSAGKGTAPIDPRAAQDLPDLSQLRKQAKSLSVPSMPEQGLQLLFEIISLGLPEDESATGAPARIEINYQKVETLLDTMGVPPELRDSVRRYFLSLAQPNPPK